VFPGVKRGKSISNMAMLVLVQRVIKRPDITVHGFRSTFRTWVSDEITGIEKEIAEVALSHAVGDDETERAYNRGELLEKRRYLMELWAAFIDEPVFKSRIRAALAAAE
jgi:integrase